LDPVIDAEALGLSEGDSRRLEKRIRREWAHWARGGNCDAARTLNFGGLQELAFLSSLMSGDVFAFLPMIERPGSAYDLKVCLVEADRVCTPDDRSYDPSIREGIEFGPWREPVAYWLCNRHPAARGIGVPPKAWERVPAFGGQSGRRNVLHLFRPERPEQLRGTPALAPVIESLKQLGRYSEAELIGAVVSACFTVFVKHDPGGVPPLGEMAIPGGEVLASAGSEGMALRAPEVDYSLGNGTIVDLEPGDSIELANPQRPNAQFDAFVVSVCRQIGAALEIPFEELLLHFSASYSASRAALLEAWRAYRRHRSRFAESFCRPIYEAWLAEAVLRGRLDMPGFLEDPILREAWSGAQWHGPSQGQIDPLKEIEAAEKRVSLGISTLTRETAEMTGESWEENAAVRIREEEIRRRFASLSGSGSAPTVYPSDGDDDPDEEDAE
jgi:lambda family phage portal protein